MTEKNSLPDAVGRRRGNLRDMVFVPGGHDLLGSKSFYPEEGPVRSVSVGGFSMDSGPVTVDGFASFVEDTGYVTMAEARPDIALIFAKPSKSPNLQPTPDRWWRVGEASWRHPYGTDGPIAQGNHPVVQVTHGDARAYADWAGKMLPSEDEWEIAARGGLPDAVFPWGDEFLIDGKHQANTWQGEFPYENLALDGWEATSPVGSFPPNGYGLFDMVGNVWEWTRDIYLHDRRRSGGCCGTSDAVLAGACEPDRRWALRGGSFLCAPNYCLRYRPTARSWSDGMSSSCHIGFRCIIRGPSAGEV